MDEPQAVGPAADAHNPYAMPQAPVALPPPLVLERVVASRGARLGARLIDTLLVYLTFVPAVAALVLGRYGNDTGFVALLVLTPLLMIALLVANIVGLDRRGQSIGKRLVGIRILRSDGSHPTLGRSFGLRAVVPLLINMVFGLFALIDALWIFGPERRCLHDLMADTIVVPAE